MRRFRRRPSFCVFSHHPHALSSLRYMSHVLFPLHHIRFILYCRVHPPPLSPLSPLLLCVVSRRSGLHTVGSVLSTPTKALLLIKGISDAKIEKILEAARKLVSTGFLTGQ